MEYFFEKLKNFLKYGKIVLIANLTQPSSPNISEKSCVLHCLISSNGNAADDGEAIQRGLFFLLTENFSASKRLGWPAI